MANNQAKKHILIFILSYFPFIGGAEIAVQEITDRISDSRHQQNFGGQVGFDIITARLDKKLPCFEKIGRANVWRVGWGWSLRLDKYLYPLLAYFKAKKLHQEKKFQIVHSIMPFYAGLAVLFFKWKFPQVRYLLTDQSGDSDWFVWLRTWFWYPLFRKIYIRADYIQVISRFLEKRARRYGYQGEIGVVPNGVDLDKFRVKNSKLKVEELKQDLDIKPNEKIIITVSRLVKKNGIDDLIRAIREYRIQNTECRIKLLILGKGKDERKLKNLVKKLGLEDKILFLGEVKYRNLPQYLALADIFVRPSLSEGLGNAFLEAMACGLPIIGTPVGGIPDFLVDPSISPEQATGLFCQPKNPQSIAQKIKELLENPALREKLIKNGLNLVREKYNWDRIAQEMRRIYFRLLI